MGSLGLLILYTLVLGLLEIQFNFTVGQIVERPSRDGSLTYRLLAFRADHHPVGPEEIFNRRSLPQKLGV
mgnify:CR=1 FL=1